MNNYNEKLDEILAKHGVEPGEMTHSLKQAITSLIKELVAEAKIDPFDFVESCEPNCDDVRHAYHQGQWDMATRIEAKQEEV